MGDEPARYSFDFSHKTPGAWEIVVDLEYLPDTNLRNNQATVQVVVVKCGAPLRTYLPLATDSQCRRVVPSRPPRHAEG